MLLTSLILISAFGFIWYGLNCLFSKKMHREFQRFGLTNFRKLTGILQLLGATGLLIGFIYPLMTVIASAGLAILMLLGFFVRIKIKDGLLVSVPAFAFMLINLYIFLSSYSGL